MAERPGEDLSVDRLLEQRRKLAEGLTKALVRIQLLEQDLYADRLTGLANERVFEEELPKLVWLAKLNDNPLALLVADVDGLKRANDIEGHATGDELIKRVGAATRESARPSDIPIRRSAGGDEFVVILPGFKPLAGQTEEELFSDTSSRFENAYVAAVTGLNLHEEVHAGVSFGIAILQPGETAPELFKRADDACMANKRTLYEDLKKSGQKIIDTRRPDR